MITSASNQRVKDVRKLLTKKREREESGLFVAEGLRIVREAPKDLIESVYISESFLEDPRTADEATLVRERAGEKWETVSDSVMQKMSDTDHPQGILAVLRMVPKQEAGERFFSALERKNPLYLALEDIQDPGNLGTMIRTAEGAGADSVLLSPGTADLYSPKVVRATMGSLFRMAVLKASSEADWTAALDRLQSSGVRLFAAALTGSVLYDTADYRGGTAFLIGNEGNGLRPETIRRADQAVRIPMGGQLESLNAAVSAGVLLYEADRQRGEGQDRSGGKQS